ncbi:MAG: hypothetical protein AMJ63_07555 [Myxococcales bacterium SG8_38_1]|jgi:hypothetical protein|nr:MAG: hypothetical protein AMJ63_07555 [Myxococcales bacterium SG8_38_1]
MMMLARQTLLRISLVAALALVLVMAEGLQSDNRVSAQDVHVTGPLAGAPSVMNQRLWREMRLHVEPFFAFTIADEYSRSLIVGGELRFHFLDWLGIGGWGGYSVATLDTNLTKEIRDKGVTTNANRLDLPSREGYPNQVGRLNWWSGVELHFVPFRGKLAMFQKIFVDADIDVFVGAAFVGVEERADVTGQPSPGNVTYCDQVGDGCLPSQDARAKRTAIAPSFGIAFNAFFKEFVGLAFRWRGIPFKYNTSGTDNNRDGQINSDDRLRQFNNMFSVGVIFTLPPKIKTTD